MGALIQLNITPWFCRCLDIKNVFVSENFLRMTFPNEWDLSEDEIETPVQEIEVEQIGGPTGGPIGGPIDSPIGFEIKLTERQKEVLLLIANNAKISRRNLAKQLNINASAMQEHIEILKKKGVLVRIGGTHGYWEVIVSEKLKK